MKNNHKKIEKSLLILILSVSLLLPSVIAVDRRYAVTGSAVDTGISSSWNETAAGNDVAQGGNSTNLNLSTTASTIKWQGYYGEVTAQLGLGGDGDAKTLYSFGAAQNNQIKAVYASTDNNFNFASLQSEVSLTVLDTTMGWPTTDSDSASTTLGGGLDNQTISRVNNVQVVNLTSYTIVGNAGQEVNYNGPAARVTTVFHSGVFADTASPLTLGDYVFAVQVNSTTNNSADSVGNEDQLNRNFLNQTGAGSAVDYQMVVPINSTAQHGETPLQKTYFFFLDIE